MFKIAFIASLAMLLVACGGGSSGVAAPSALSYTSPLEATMGTAITPLSPTVTGTVSSYSVSPSLPAGLSLSKTSGALSGTPTGSAAQATYTISATNTGGSTTFALVLTVKSGKAISGTAASGSPITPAMNGTVTLKDSSSPAKLASTTTDVNGLYSFTAAEIQGFTAPFMLEIAYKVGGASYYLTSAATAADVESGDATINITPLTDLVIANLGNEIAAKIFANGNYSSLLTTAALNAGVAALDKVLEPVLVQMGISGSVNLLQQSFTANGQGLDAVLDALQVTIDPVTNNETITNRLNNTSVSGTLSAPPTTPVTASATNNVTDLQGIAADFNNLAAELATAPSPSDAALLAFFDQTQFKEDGQNLASFLQKIATSPTIAGGSFALTDIVLSSVPSWVTTVPAHATAYDVSFTVLIGTAPNGRNDFIVYADSKGTWLILGDQEVAKANASAFEGDNGGVMCSGMNFAVNDNGGLGLSYAVVTGPGLAAEGILLFNSGGNNSFNVAAGGPATYTGTNTPGATSSCGYSIYEMSDVQIQAITTLPAIYTIKLYKDNGTPTNLTDDILVATYTSQIPAAPLLSASLTAALFASDIVATPTVLSLAATGGTVTVSWTAPTAAGLYVNSLSLFICNSSGCQSENQDLAPGQVSTTIAVPATPGMITGDGATVEYSDSVFRSYWTNPPAASL